MTLKRQFNQESLIPRITHAPKSEFSQAQEIKAVLEHAFGEQKMEVGAGVDVNLTAEATL